MLEGPSEWHVHTLQQQKAGARNEGPPITSHQIAMPQKKAHDASLEIIDRDPLRYQGDKYDLSEADW